MSNGLMRVAYMCVTAACRSTGAAWRWLEGSMQLHLGCKRVACEQCEECAGCKGAVYVWHEGCVGAVQVLSGCYVLVEALYVQQHLQPIKQH